MRALLTRETFANWAKIYLKNNGTIIDYGVNDVSLGLEYSKMLHYKDFYWIWWQDGVGLVWYGQQIPNEFKPVFRAGEIVIYKY
jgi:hypothetical protein